MDPLYVSRSCGGHGDRSCRMLLDKKILCRKCAIGICIILWLWYWSLIHDLTAYCLLCSKLQICKNISAQSSTNVSNVIFQSSNVCDRYGDERKGPVCVWRHTRIVWFLRTSRNTLICRGSAHAQSHQKFFIRNVCVVVCECLDFFFFFG